MKKILYRLQSENKENELMIENDMYNFDGYSTFLVRNQIESDKF
jgi:hypothetical protein